MKIRVKSLREREGFSQSLAPADINPLQKIHSFTYKRVHTLWDPKIGLNCEPSGLSISNALNLEKKKKVNKLMDKFEGMAC